MFTAGLRERPPMRRIAIRGFSEAVNREGDTIHDCTPGGRSRTPFGAVDAPCGVANPLTSGNHVREPPPLMVGPKLFIKVGTKAQFSKLWSVSGPEL